MVSPPVQHLPPRPGPPPHGIVQPPPPPPAPQAFSVPDGQPQAQQAVSIPNNYAPGQTGPLVAHSITYNPSTSATAQVHTNTEAAASINMHKFLPAVTPLLQPAEQTSVATSVPVTTDLSKAVEKAASDWIEHTSHKGKRYYHNKKTKISSWEKPLELMSPIERADASTNWKECTAPDGRKYYYNKVTKQSRWRIPEELKLARDQVAKTNCIATNGENGSIKDPENEVSAPPVTNDIADSPPSRAHEPVSSPIPVAPLMPAVQSIESFKVTTNVTSDEIKVPATLPDPAAPALSNTEDVKDAVVIAESGTPESKRGTVTNDSVEDKTADLETQVYENKQEAKNAFKALLESANVASDWTWDQAMRVIINDWRYGALKPLAERKQAFNEFLSQKKKQEAEERRNKQKKAREEFKKMLEDSKEITSSTKWSKAIAIFEDDDRFKAVERAKDREDLFDDHVQELEKKERSKALEEHKKNRKEYIEFLKSCDFLTASSQWRKVQDRLEADESCLRLEKIDRLEIFQEYIRDLEKHEEEQRKQRMEELRKTERKNRDEFRKLMDGHIASGMLTSKSHWRDYCTKVKDLPAYLAVSSNVSGATAKELFEDVIEELEKQYLEDRDRIKESVKMRKVSILSTWTLEDLKNAISEDIISSPLVSDVNLKLVFDELQERVREREEKEAKRRKRLADDFYISLTTSKDITSSSRWEDFKPLFEDRLESWFSVEESFFREIFDKYIAELKKARDERKHREDKVKKSTDGKDRDRDRDRRTEKSRRDKDKDNRGKKDNKRKKDETDSENGDNNLEENRRLSGGRDKEKKHRKRRLDDMSLGDSHRHSKKAKQLEQQASGSVEYNNRHKRYKRSHNRRGGISEYDDHREAAEDGEVW